MMAFLIKSNIFVCILVLMVSYKVGGKSTLPMQKKYSEIDEGEHRYRRGVILASKSRKWSSNIIPVVISHTYKEKQKLNILEALRQWENATCLRFNIVPAYEGPHIIFNITHPAKCQSSIGMRNSKKGQLIPIGPGCMRVGTILHEVGHALGLFHEQERPDRNRYVNVLYENVYKNARGNYNKMSWKKVKTVGTPFDYSSLMLYREHQFSRKGKKSMVTLDDDMHETVGNKFHLSFYDAKIVNYHYCKSECERGLLWKRCYNGGYRDTNNCSKCVCPDGLTGRFCEDVMDGVNGDCGAKRRIATEKWTTLTSPGFYGKGSKAYSSCNWLIETQPGKRLLLKVEELKLDCWEKMACDEDYIAIHYKTNLALPGPRFCCKRPRRTFVSHGTQMLLLYRVRELYQNHGVRLSYRAENCGGCNANSKAAIEPPCLKTKEVNCYGRYRRRCLWNKKKRCTYYRKNKCLKEVKKCCRGYTLSGDKCKECDKVCENDSRLNKRKCTCWCYPNYTGDTCAILNCHKSDPWYCSPSFWTEEDCRYTSVAHRCVHMCGKC
ncbi:zinc metalloproteinase dpy-31-like [Gigantopelta aegis]|uniref:zinc metalloproteinase dpy-31-like n=1 Tax=Gigantopelta aegis TaxID=1735272 RepID=UPI001B889DCF|nr:zinc metalloproteinase dpy-31-like [Gigantopelta aegis]